MTAAADMGPVAIARWFVQYLEDEGDTVDELQMVRDCSREMIGVDSDKLPDGNWDVMFSLACETRQDVLRKKARRQ